MTKPNHYYHPQPANKNFAVWEAYYSQETKQHHLHSVYIVWKTQNPLYINRLSKRTIAYLKLKEKQGAFNCIDIENHQLSVIFEERLKARKHLKVRKHLKQ